MILTIICMMQNYEKYLVYESNMIIRYPFDMIIKYLYHVYGDNSSKRPVTCPGDLGDLEDGYWTGWLRYSYSSYRMLQIQVYQSNILADSYSHVDDIYIYRYRWNRYNYMSIEINYIYNYPVSLSISYSHRWDMNQLKKYTVFPSHEILVG